MIVTLFIVILTAILFFFFQRDNPVLWNLPIIGSLHLLDPKTPYLSLSKMVPKHGKIFKLKLGTIPTLVIADPIFLKKVFAREETAVRPPFFILQEVFKERGLLNAKGHLWRNQRKLVSDFFKKVGASKVKTVNGRAEECIKENVGEFVQTHQKCNPVEPLEYYVGSVISSLLLGKKWKRDDETFTGFCKDLKKLAKLITHSPLNLFPFLKYLPHFKTIQEYQTRLNNAQKANIEFSVDNIKPNLVEAFFAAQSKQNAQNHFYTEDQLISLVNDLFGATMKTTVNSIFWVLLFLAQDENLQTKVRAELKNLENPSFDDLVNLPFLQAVLAETSRIKTLSPLGFPHYTTKDVVVDNIKIKQGTTLIPLFWHIHMDPEVWENPETFLPERFLRDGKFQAHESHFPFSVGRRMCVGNNLARMMVIMVVASTVQHFKITGDFIDLSEDFNLVLSPKPQQLTFSCYN